MNKRPIDFHKRCSFSGSKLHRKAAHEWNCDFKFNCGKRRIIWTNDNNLQFCFDENHIHICLFTKLISMPNFLLSAIIYPWLDFQPSSSLSTGCVVSLRGDWAIFCHAGSGRVGRVWSARGKSLEILRRGWESNPGHREDRQRAFPLSYHDWLHTQYPVLFSCVIIPRIATMQNKSNFSVFQTLNSRDLKLEAISIRCRTQNELFVKILRHHCT